MTENALAQSSVRLFSADSGYDIARRADVTPCPPRSRSRGTIPRRRSSSAWALSRAAASPFPGLRADSAQGDRAVLDILRTMGACAEEAAAGITVRRGTLHGAVIDAARRLRPDRALRARCGGGRGDARCECRAAPARGIRPARSDCGDARFSRRARRGAAGGTHRSRRRTSRRRGERAARPSHRHGGGGGGVRLHRRLSQSRAGSAQINPIRALARTLTL